MSRNALLKSARLIHLYFGVFITPALIFFAFTGAIQTFGLHETNRDHPTYTPAKWLVVLGQIHKKQTPIVNPRRPQPTAAQGAPTPQAAESGEHHHKNQDSPNAAAPAAGQSTPAPVADAPKPAPPASKHNPLPLRIFFLIVSIGLLTSTTTGLYMSYKYVRNKLAITLTLIAGIVLPLLLVFV